MSSLLNFLDIWPFSRDSRRKRRIDPVESRLPKLRRISGNFFGSSNNFTSSDVSSRRDRIIEENPYLVVKKKRVLYNDILESFLMEQQDKQKNLNRYVEEDYTDKDTNTNFPSTSSAFNQRQTEILRDIEEDDIEFVSRTQLKPAKPVPPLLPLSGFSTGESTSRRMNSDFVNRNRAFPSRDLAPGLRPANSILDYSHKVNSRKTYESLIKSMLSCYKQPHNPRENLSIETSFKSSAESSPDGFKHSRNDFYLNSNINRLGRTAVQKPICTIDISEDDDSINSYRNEVTKELKANTSASTSKVDFSSIKPVNSLAERTEHKKCLQDNAIVAICERFSASRKKNDDEIQIVNQTISQLSLETANEEKLQQRRISDAISKLEPTYVISEEDDKIEEFPPLNQEQLRTVEFGLRGGYKGEVLISKFNFNITRNDINTLDGLNWLNDEVINFYMELLKDRSLQDEYLPRVHAMNTFFIPKLLQSGFAGVKRWTRKIDIFSYDIIPVPVHVSGVHWCMSIINIKEKTIKYYDSMGAPNAIVLQALQNYLQEESMDKKKEVLNMSNWTLEHVRNCPQQSNGSDCGVFSCMFAEFLTRESKISFDQSHMQYFRRKMIYEIMKGKLLL